MEEGLENNKTRTSTKRKSSEKSKTYQLWRKKEEERKKFLCISREVLSSQVISL